MIRRRDDTIETLTDALYDYMNVDELKKLARLTGSRPPTRKAELVDHIVGYLKGNRLASVWRDLDELQQAAVAEVVHSKGTRLDRGRFLAKYRRNPGWASYRNPNPTRLQFFLYGNDVMPVDLKERLEPIVPRPAAAKVETVDIVEAYSLASSRRSNRPTARSDQSAETLDSDPPVVQDREKAAQRELLSVLRLVDAGKVAVSDKTRKPTAATVKAVGAILGGDDFYPHMPPANEYEDCNAGPIRAFAWPMIVQAGKLAQLSGRRLRLTGAGRRALSDPTADTIAEIWAQWVDSTLFDELLRIDSVKGQTGKGKRGLTDPYVRRDAVDATLAECPPNEWIEADEFIRFMRASGHDFAVTRDPWRLYIGNPEYGAFGYDGFLAVLNVRYVLCVLLEYAATFGLIDVALVPPADARSDHHDIWGADELPYMSRYDGLVYIRVNALGAYCLGIAVDYEPTPLDERVVLQVMSNFEIAAVGVNFEQQDRLALDAYAVPVSDRVWRLETDKLLSAADQGRPISEIREFLSVRTATPLPNTVVRLLDDTADRCACVHDRGMARLVECDEAAIATLIANDTLTRKHCMLSGDHHLVIPAASESAFKRNLRGLGYILAR